MNARRNSNGKKKVGCLGLIGIVVGGFFLLSIVGGLLAGVFGSSAQEDETPRPLAEVAQPNLGEKTVVRSIIDGDTLETEAGTVRIIGIDTPESGLCGFGESISALTALASPNSTVYLELPDGQNDRDQYDRLLRYVTTENGVDVGQEQISAGHAVARYGSQDGYPAHPKEAEYRSSQTATLTPEGAVVSGTCVQKAAEAAAAQAEADRIAAEQAAAAQLAAAQAATWWTQYPSCAQLKKNSNGHPTGPFNVNDPAQTEIYNHFQYGTSYRGDGDGDGWACE